MDQIMSKIPEISEYMTRSPHTVGKRVPLKTALEIMRNYKVRHLPVQDSGKLVGILSGRDLESVLAPWGASLETGFNVVQSAAQSAAQSVLDGPVEEVMTSDPYAVQQNTPLDEVVLHMAIRKYHCVIIQDDHAKIVGVFTATDALRALAEVLHLRYAADKVVAP